MTIVRVNGGQVTLVIGTPTKLFIDIVTQGLYLCEIDWSTLVGGDTLTGAAAIATENGGLEQPDTGFSVTGPPVVGISGVITAKSYLGPYPINTLGSFWLKQTVGVGKQIIWTIWQL